METWTNKMGYPVVTVTRNYQTGQALIEQVKSYSISILMGNFYIVIHTGTIFVE